MHFKNMDVKYKALIYIEIRLHGFTWIKKRNRGTKLENEKKSWIWLFSFYGLFLCFILFILIR